MKYAEFSFYQTEYLGDRITDESTFNRLALRASERLDYFTFGKIDGSDVSDSVRLAVCSMADILFWEEKRKNAHEGRELASESNDGYSVSFASASDTERQGLTDRQLYQAAYVYLSQSGLMDFGVEL
ncbi:MAG: hypothetical protein IJ706_10975 [Clostridia bacterium]|nr:hypothetical protein [Clostridia bacterium]MBR1677815.1 hypothetical protein [Clostridia bacterium]